MMTNDGEDTMTIDRFQVGDDSDGHTYWRDADPHIRRFLDGHTYWRDADGEWMGAPTHRDGTHDISEAGFVRDFNISAADRESLEAWLANREGDA